MVGGTGGSKLNKTHSGDQDLTELHRLDSFVSRHGGKPTTEPSGNFGSRPTQHNNQSLGSLSKPSSQCFRYWICKFIKRRFQRNNLSTPAGLPCFCPRRLSLSDRPYRGRRCVTLESSKAVRRLL